MNSAMTSLLIFLALVAAVLLGHRVRRYVPDHHLSADSKDAVKLAVGLVATMTALLLGLLVSSAKSAYDAQRSEVIQMAAKITFLDRALIAYGPEASEVREALRAAVWESVHTMWPDEAGVRLPTLSSAPSSGVALLAAMQRLSPRDETQRILKAQIMTEAMDLGEIRMLLLAQMVPSIPRPLLIAVAFWLVVTFLIFSLLAPPNATTMLSLMIAAVSVAAAVFLILELDQPLGGLIRVPGESMFDAMNQLAK